MKMLKWAPVWAHVFASAAMLLHHNGLASWFAIAAAYYAFCWVARKPTGWAEGERLAGVGQ